jgi:sugar/nucleoside kinase (ribokinase family)
VRCSDIVKFSNENIPDASFADGFRDKLFVQTLGKEGLRYKFLDGDWKTLPPVVNAHVVDTEGAGDATTSAIIYGIACSGKRFRDLDETELVRILTDAQRFASRSVSRMGTKATAVKD